MGKMTYKQWKACQRKWYRDNPHMVPKTNKSTKCTIDLTMECALCGVKLPVDCIVGGLCSECASNLGNLD